MIPLGFRFHPTDEELITGFLLVWLLGHALPWNGIVEKQLYGENFPREPWKVFSDLDESSMLWHSKTEGGPTKNIIYVFTVLLRVPNSNRISRRAGCGTWVARTGPKKIKNSGTGEIIGQSRMFVFEHSGEAAEADVGHWTMHEYSLSDEMVRRSGRPNGADLVLCKITKTIKKKESGGKCAQQQQLQLCSPAEIGDGGGIDITVAQPEFIYRTIGSGSIDRLVCADIGDGGDSIDIGFLAATTALNKRAAEVDYPNEEDVEGGFKRMRKSCGDGEIFSDAAAVESFHPGSDGFQPFHFDDNFDVEGLFDNGICWGSDGEVFSEAAAVESFQFYPGSDGEVFSDAAAVESFHPGSDGFQPFHFDDNIDVEGLFDNGIWWGSDGEVFPDAATVESFHPCSDDFQPFHFDDDIDVEGLFVNGIC